MHFAALAYVGESVTDPLAYYDNNTAGTISLLKAMRETGVKRLVFSSTCATYGEPTSVPIVETMRQEPINPYGWSKWCVERILRDWAAADPEFSFAALRYFNVAGSAADGSLGEDHDPETHLIPSLLLAALRKRGPVVVFGTDYPTPDGTCIRDYIHVDDLCDAHLVAMEALRSGDTRVYNLGIGRGYSVREVIARPGRLRRSTSRSSSGPGVRATRPCSSPTPRRSAASWAGRLATPKSGPSSPPPGTGFAPTPTATATEAVARERQLGYSNRGRRGRIPAVARGDWLRRLTDVDPPMCFPATVPVPFCDGHENESTDA